MPEQQILRWLDGRGWLVLSGRADVLEDVRAMALERAVADGGIAYLTAGMEDEDRLLSEWGDLGAPAGFLVDLQAEDDETIRNRVGDAGMVYLGGPGATTEFRSSLMGAAVAGMQAAYENGALIIAEGNAAAALGTYVLMDDGEMTRGVEWVHEAYIAPHITSLAESAAARAVVGGYPTAILIGLGPGSALALGPDGQVETWGRKEVTIALGSAYTSD